MALCFAGGCYSGGSGQGVSYPNALALMKVAPSVLAGAGGVGGTSSNSGGGGGGGVRVGSSFPTAAKGSVSSSASGGVGYGAGGGSGGKAFTIPNCAICNCKSRELLTYPVNCQV